MVVARGERSAMQGAGLLIVLGALMMLAKGLLLMVTGNDRSLVPWFGLFATAGFVTAAVALWRQASRLGWLALGGAMLAVVGVGASIVAVGYLVTGTIPETTDAPATVEASYVILSAALALSVLAVGIVVARNRSLIGRWRWLPVGVAVAQFPVFILAGAIGDGIGSEEVTDGLGLALTGVIWVVLGYAFFDRHQRTAPPTETSSP